MRCRSFQPVITLITCHFVLNDISNGSFMPPANEVIQFYTKLFVFNLLLTLIMTVSSSLIKFFLHHWISLRFFKTNGMGLSTSWIERICLITIIVSFNYWGITAWLNTRYEKRMLEKYEFITGLSIIISLTAVMYAVIFMKLHIVVTRIGYDHMKFGTLRDIMIH